MYNDVTARLLLREVSIWLNGYCTALGDDAPFGVDHLTSFIAADGALHERITRKLDAAATEEPKEHDDNGDDQEHTDQGTVAGS